MQLRETGLPVASIQQIVLSCTNRKRDAGPRLRDVPAGATADRIKAWVDRVSVCASSFPARDLYQGEYWQAALDLARASADRGRARVAVMSAGLGLIDADDPIPAYEATFARSHADSVCVGGNPTARRREWWEGIA